MTNDEFRSLRTGDRIRHMSSTHILRIIKVWHNARDDVYDALVERNFTISIHPLEDWLIASQPRIK